MTVWAAFSTLLAGLAVGWALRPRPHCPGPVRARPGEPSESEAAGKEGLARYRSWLSATAGLAVAVWVGSWLGVALGIAAFAGLFHAVSSLEPPSVRRRRACIARDLPHVADLMASALAAGSSPAAALNAVAATVTGPVREELAVVRHRLMLGDDPVRVWRSVADHPQLGPLGRCLARASDTGQSVSEAMHRLSEDLRRDARAKAEGRARSVGVRSAAPLGLCLLPAFVLVGVVPLVASAVGVLLTR